MSASLSNLGYLLLKKGRLAEAEPLIREGVEQHKKLAGYLNSTTAEFISQLAEMLYAKHDYKGPRALPKKLFRSTLKRCRKEFGFRSAALAIGPRLERGQAKRICAKR